MMFKYIEKYSVAFVIIALVILSYMIALVISIESQAAQVHSSKWRVIVHNHATQYGRTKQRTRSPRRVIVITNQGRTTIIINQVRK